MTVAITSPTASGRRLKIGSISRDRRWALRLSYFFLVVFAIFFLTPPAQLSTGIDYRSHDHHADCGARSVRTLAHEILGLSCPRDRNISHLSDTGDTAIHPAV